VAEYKRFRELARELIEISDHICDLRLKDLQGLGEIETKKNAIAASLPHTLRHCAGTPFPGSTSSTTTPWATDPLGDVASAHQSSKIHR